MKVNTPKKQNRPGRPGKDDDRNLKAEILNAATTLFSKRGFTKVNIKDITDHAQVSIGLVRHYFGTKDALIAEVNAQVIADLQAAFATIGKNLEIDDNFFEKLQERIVLTLTPRLYLLQYLKHLVLESPQAAHPVFEAYFQMLQTHFNRLEARGLLRVDANKVWLTFLLMFIQMGPVFLSEQIEDIIGRPAYDPDVVKERAREIASLFTSALR